MRRRGTGRHWQSQSRIGMGVVNGKTAILGTTTERGASPRHAPTPRPTATGPLVSVRSGLELDPRASRLGRLVCSAHPSPHESRLAFLILFARGSRVSGLWLSGVLSTFNTAHEDDITLRFLGHPRDPIRSDSPPPARPLSPRARAEAERELFSSSPRLLRYLYWLLRTRHTYVYTSNESPFLNGDWRGRD